MELKKYKKYHTTKNINIKANISLRLVKKATYGIKILEFGVITPKQVETARRLISRITKRAGKSFINVHFNQPITKKPLLSRMGKGAGGVDSWISYVTKGKIIIEIMGVSKKTAICTLKAIQRRISLKMKLVTREILDA